MVSETQRQMTVILCLFKVWRLQNDLFSLVQVVPRVGTKWLFNWMLRTQKVDDLHHAPMCPANHFHRKRLVFSSCTCGAETFDRLSRSKNDGNQTE